MSDVFGCEVLSLEDVSQVAFAIGADDFHPVTVSIPVPFDLASDFVIETWPAAATVKLALRLIERGVALPADVEPVFLVLCVFTDAWSFCTLIDDDTCFFLCKRIVDTLGLFASHRLNHLIFY